MMGYICLNLAIYILYMGNALPNTQPPLYNPNDISSYFNLNIFDIQTATFTGLTAIASIITILTKNYVFAAGLLVIFVLGAIFTPTQMLFNGMGTLLNALLPSELAWIAVVIQVLYLIPMFFFMAEILSQRQIT